MNIKNDIIIVKLSDVDIKVQNAAIRVFVDSFYKSYKSISRDKNILTKFMLDAFDANLSYAAILNDVVVGFFAICNGIERSLKFDKIRGNIIFRQMMWILGKPNLKSGKDVAIDHLATDENYRGQGVASAMIDYVCSKLCDSECFIDVASNNLKAKNLYEYVGFKEYSKDKSLLMCILGFGYVIRMKKSLK